MKRAILLLIIALVCLLNAACSSKAVKGNVAGVEITVDSVKRMKEYKPPGSGSGYGQTRSFQADPGKEFLVVELKAPKKIEFGDTGIKATVKDDKGQTYDSIYSQVFGFNDGKTEAKILFEMPERSVVSTLMLDQTPFDLSKAKA